MTKISTITTVSALFTLHAAFGQGTLTPPGSPAPTMKTLTQIEPRTPISSLPYTITVPGSYYLTGNVTNPGVGTGITVSSGNVTLDLNGFTLQGIPTSGDGIFVNGTLTNLVFRNGTVTGWGGHGINAWSGGFPRNMLFEKLTVSANNQNGIYTEAGSVIRDCIAIGNNVSGFFSQGGEVIGCLARNNNYSGFDINNGSVLNCVSDDNDNYGFYLVNARMLDCDCLNNLFTGIYCTGNGNEIRRCRILENSVGGIFCAIGAQSTMIENCEISDNTDDGIQTGGGVGGAYIGGNNFVLNTGVAIDINDSNNYLENNHIVTSSGVDGIEIGSSETNNVGVRNVVVGGGSVSVNYNVFGSDFGPIGTAASATSPFANISH